MNGAASSTLTRGNCDTRLRTAEYLLSIFTLFTDLKKKKNTFIFSGFEVSIAHGASFFRYLGYSMTRRRNPAWSETHSKTPLLYTIRPFISKLSF